MVNYITQINSIKTFSNNEWSRNSFSAKDYRELIIENDNLVKLTDLLEKKHKVGKEIGSNSYMKKSKYRFLKTVNISKSFLLNERNIEYCKPENKIFPQKHDILIVKDGAGSGLGEVCLYPYENKSKTDSISSGVISIKIKDEKLYYVFGLLKSQHFKNFVDLNTAQGSTIRHSKIISLNYDVPFPNKLNNSNPKDIEDYVSLIVQNIIDKESQVKAKRKEIDNIVQNELIVPEVQNKFKYSYPKISEIKEQKRFDTGLYEKDYKEIDFIIQNYKNGYFNLDSENIKSGSTPKVRIFNPISKNFKWVTPTNIFDEGFYNPIMTINIPTKNNLNKDCILIINRTSKGKKGEFVGISCFYECSTYGLGQHNQGLYKIEKYSKFEKLFIVSMLNCDVFRKICGYVSIGSKMKEMKTYDFTKLKIPKFHDKVKEKIISRYYKNIEKNNLLNLENYLDKEKKRNSYLGIFQLDNEIFKLKSILDEIILLIISNEKIEIILDY